MAIEKILKQLTPERIEKEIEAVQKVKLPPELQKWVKEYEKVGDRDEFIWKWIYSAIQLITLPIVDKKYKNSIWRIKTYVLVIFDILLNDVADRSKNKRLLNELLKIPFSEKNIKLNYLTKKEKKYLAFTKRFWECTFSQIKRCPRYEELKEIFNYDIAQIIIANQYDYLIAKYHYLINKTENWLYSPCTMGGMLCGTIDVMCSSKFDIKELGVMREVLWEAQKMARIGNWISTWKREIGENDFTSGVFVYALDLDILNNNELKKRNESKISKKIKNSKIEERLLEEWLQSYKKIDRFRRKLKSVDIKEFINGLEKLLILELVSRQYK